MLLHSLDHTALCDLLTSLSFHLQYEATVTYEAHIVPAVFTYTISGWISTPIEGWKALWSCLEDHDYRSKKDKQVRSQLKKRDTIYFHKITEQEVHVLPAKKYKMDAGHPTDSYKVAIACTCISWSYQFCTRHHRAITPQFHKLITHTVPLACWSAWAHNRETARRAAPD